MSSFYHCTRVGCNRKYKLESKLEYHLENDHNIICDQCEYSFKNERQLQKHKNYKHKILDESNIYECDQCERKPKFNSEIQLLKHINNKHNSTFYNCPHQGCNKRYRSYEKLCEHRDEAHYGKVKVVIDNVVAKKDEYCCICMENEPIIAIVPCGHKSLCEICQHLLDKTRGCPICRCEITSFLKIFS